MPAEVHLETVLTQWFGRGHREPGCLPEGVLDWLSPDEAVLDLGDPPWHRSDYPFDTAEADPARFAIDHGPSLEVARELLRNPAWFREAADHLGATLNFPPQYSRAFR